jgi:RNA polymerase sigma-70 factor (ECF subfamily)
MSFADRLARGRSGDRQALEELLAPWRSLLKIQADQLLGGELAARVDPSDIVQEAFTHAVAHLDQFRGGTVGEWVNWLRSILAGHAANAQRHHFAEKRTVEREDGQRPTSHLDPLPGPEGQAILHEQDARLAEALAALPEDMRAVIVRRVFRQEPFEVVAAALVRSPGAARVLWTRALRRLRELLADG